MDADVHSEAMKLSSVIMGGTEGGHHDSSKGRIMTESTESPAEVGLHLELFMKQFLHS